MFGVLIVDDEVYVIKLIEKMVDWDSLNMRVLGIAQDGVSALSMIEELQPHIVLTDIRMPGFDGITLMQKAKELRQNIRFVAISGHKNFEYAKSAIQYNVEDYIVKPIDKEELEGILRKLKTKLEQEEQKTRARRQLDDEIDTSTQRIRAMFFDRLLKGDMQGAPCSPHEWNAAYYTRFAEDSLFQFFVVKIDSEEKNIDKGFLQKLREKIKQTVYRQLAPHCNDILLQGEQYRVSGLLNFDNGLQRLIEQSLQGVVAELQEQFSDFQIVYVTLVTMDPFYRADEIAPAIPKTQQLLGSRFCLGVGRVILPSDIRQDSGAHAIIFSDARRVAFLKAVKLLGREELSEVMGSIFTIAREYEAVHSFIYQEISQTMLQIFVQTLQQAHVLHAGFQEMWNRFEEQLEACLTGEDVQAVITGLFDFCLEEYHHSCEKGNSPSVRIAKRYIAENYPKDVSLADVAQTVNLSPVYFSILFKKETGINFIDYLHQCRVDVAKGLLIDVTNNITEISSQCGYKDARHFSKTFKKLVGVTPTEFRNRNVY